MIVRRWKIFYIGLSDGRVVKWPGAYYTRKRAMNEADRQFGDGRVAYVKNIATGEEWKRRRGSWFKITDRAA